MENGEYYKNLFERSVIANEVTAAALKTLAENSVKMNDEFILHKIELKEVNSNVKQTLSLLTKYLKWAIIALIAAVGGKEIISFIAEKFV